MLTLGMIAAALFGCLTHLQARLIPVRVMVKHAAGARASVGGV
jgi:hypothetical protein